MFFSDIDECSADSIPCDENADCTNSDGSYSCTCKQGFTGDGATCDGKPEHSQKLCYHTPKNSSAPLNFLFNFSVTSDIDECSADSSPCDENADCTNSDGSYSCTCKQGFTGNGSTCTGIDLDPLRSPSAQVVSCCYTF